MLGSGRVREMANAGGTTASESTYILPSSSPRRQVVRILKAPTDHFQKIEAFLHANMMRDEEQYTPMTARLYTRDCGGGHPHRPERTRN